MTTQREYPMDHDAPEQIAPHSLNDYLEVMTKAVFQSGLSWKVVSNKWPGFQAGFKARLYAKFRGSNGCHHVGTPPLMAGVGGFSLSAANTDVQELPATLYH